MDISEQVLFNTLAQILQKQAKAVSKKAAPTQQAFNVITPESQPTTKIDELFELERKIIEILLLYGSLSRKILKILYWRPMRMVRYFIQTRN